ncbi:MAG: TetR/AcrR family transcriptional regulator [Dehalococcoidia bacterium]|nr:MAG: TetR/AcrR family transcriptional regulator [Dehalococcoidia bacterium]
MVHNQSDDFELIIPDLENEDSVTRTFRRLDPLRRQAVLDALFEEAAEKGPSRLNIKQVAERSGASIGSLYQYFGSRENLVRFLIKVVVGSMVSLLRMSSTSLRDVPFREALRYYLVEGIRISQSQKSLTRFLTLSAYQGDEEIGKTVVRPIAVVMRETVRDLLAAGVARGELRADLDLEAASRAVNVLIIGLGDSQLTPHLNTYFQVSDDEVAFERTLDLSLDMILHGLAAESPR